MTRWLQAALGALPPKDKIDINDKNPPERIKSFSSILSEGGKSGSPAPATVAADDGGGPKLHDKTDKSAARDLRPNLKLDPLARPDDTETYADALHAYGPMTYGTAMRRLGWGGTRAGQAEAALKQAGRIAFNDNGRAYLVPEKENDR